MLFNLSLCLFVLFTNRVNFQVVSFEAWLLLDLVLKFDATLQERFSTETRVPVVETVASNLVLCALDAMCDSYFSTEPRMPVEKNV